MDTFTLWVNVGMVSIYSLLVGFVAGWEYVPTAMFGYGLGLICVEVSRVYKE